MSDRTVTIHTDGTGVYRDINASASPPGMPSPNTVHVPHSQVSATSESRLAGIPEDLRFIVDKLLLMHDGGWEVCGFQGGGSGKVQFQKVEWRRVKHGTE